MKGVDIFCKSQAATSICLSMEQNSTSSPSSVTLLGGAAAIDRHNPIIKDSRRNPNKPTAATSKSQKPDPKKKRSTRIPSDENENDQPKKTHDTSSLSKLDDDNSHAITSNVDATAIVKKSWSCTKPGDFLSPPGSTRYLLREKAQYSTLSDSDSTKLSAEESSNKNVEMEEPAPSDSSQMQVVILRVSLHCRGCERKLRKHLSRMEGVTSFNIDFAAKKVTVAGNVTPLDVVSSISKVKNAQLWSPSISSSNPTPEIKNLDSEIDFQTKGAL
ncbi:hypothetical protein C2S53_007117 [Perilla frutescens var. hirtella]|uniref:HMA domain-containing protein n=1 Tax=Perilla frutescens var. hirtella TaxID=608512 RepID=A0AAD4INI2_PERFH|nr:hypothetical protein C2S53_007117 [Perilla frutescens var. hirtella]